ncbi:putative Rossmann fold nucleotide-binding protein involved in DNA uptake [Mycobacteroides abscessus]|uniref:DNA transporter n=2 Tax=Mycolicibacterium TaxID=1866885 RepID=A0A0D1KYA3_9MYCO|nr:MULTISPECIES: DNA processing protein DprA [Mycobacteriaceae]MEE3066860.1 DNA processing protein DprA [Actinomycetota bacterium]KIU13800.1 DNA transporter [Mycolicibacterium llatzerense]MCQ4360226.1 DNA processing protein DprA [Mycobacterium gordonae]MCT7373250.1 DNA processing protein DprA [Mycolicibacterium llatzerense]WGI35867.1 DNA processing protein DprA [Mycolicibacterium aubagnense]
MAYSAASTVVALMRDLPKTLTLAGIGEALLDVGSADQLWEEHVATTLVSVPGTEPDRDAAARDVEQWTARGWRALTVLDTAYPDRVRAARRPPALLMTEGTLATDAYSVAIVGSRKASAAGIDFARGVALGLAAHDVTVVSGLAEGIDTAAMTAALELGGRVVGVIGTGIDHAYPAPNAKLQATIAERGLLLTQFLPGFRGAPWAFPARNKTMSAYSGVTVIAEASEKSGTKHQATEAVAHGRRLVLHSSVATGTTWGRELRDRPDVFVASTAGEAVAQLEQIAAADQTVRSHLARQPVGTAW